MLIRLADFIIDKSLAMADNLPAEAWTSENIARSLPKEVKAFKGAMTVLRYALTGQKVGAALF